MAANDQQLATSAARATTAQSNGLASLLGRTRAHALEALADPCTTGELARRIGVSPATASHHATVLRAAGLISSHRDGVKIVHRLTAKGTTLLGLTP